MQILKTEKSQLFAVIFSFLKAGLVCLGMMSGISYAQVIEMEDFGTGSYPGAPLPAGQTTYNYNAPPQPADFDPNDPSAILDDGDYVLATDSQQGFTSWSSIGDNTTGSGYMMLVNADDDQSGEFYRRQVAVTSNTTYELLTYLVNVNSQGDFDFCTSNEGGLILPNVTLKVEDSGGTILASFDTGDIPFNPMPVWGEYKFSFTTPASTTSIDAVLVNNSIGGCGNDLAIDDITFRVEVTMEAVDDSVTVTDTTSAQSAILLLGANDTLGGNPLPGTENYTIAPLSSLPSGITLNGNTGEVGIAAGTPEGTYTFDYQVCETSNMYNCDTATATIIVDLSTEITAVNDGGSVADSSTGFTPVLNVLSNDVIDGSSPPASFELSVSAGSSLPTGLSFDETTGEVGVLQNASSGVHAFDYDICELGNPMNCETATVTIYVTNPGGGSFCPAGTTGFYDTYHVISATGGDNPERAVGQPLPEGTTETGDFSARTFFDTITMDLTGDPDISVPEGEVIEISLSSAFDNEARAEILMSADGVTYTSLGTTGQGGSVYGAWTSNIMRYDDFTVPAGGARFLQVDHQNRGVRADGVIYGTQCQLGSAPVVAAADDSETIESSAAVQPAVLNVTDNDTFDGVTPTAFDLSINSSSSLPAELTFDTATGDVGVAAGTPEGVYSFDYDICEVGTPYCDTATVTMTVTAPAAPNITASKSIAIYDPNNIGLYFVPGNDVVYTITVQNTGPASVDDGSMLLIDVLPGELTFYNADMNGAFGPETDPVIFTDNSSNLTFTYATDVGYSQSDTKPADFVSCDYTPTGGYDPATTYICFNPKGEMLPSSDWSVSFRMRIK